MTVEIVEINNPQAFKLPDIRDLFERSFAYSDDFDADKVIRQIQLVSSLPLFHIIVAQQRTSYRALLIGIEPVNDLIPQPEVFHFFNEGTKETLDALISYFVEKMRARGYSEIRTINRRPNQSKAYFRLFDKAGEGEVIGHLVRFKTGE